MINFEYSRVSSVKAAVDMLSKNPTGGFIAGGTNLVDLMKKNVTAPTRLIDITNLPLKQIEENSNGLNIGALALNSDVSENEVEDILSRPLQDIRGRDDSRIRSECRRAISEGDLRARPNS